eukprot:CAMPEP_0171662224 /NCGR_PEP_ID=MMETSP0990-20121206/45405_1 /TAXON_ID=483369 /ORGANISM="non described non described, Strain CCMP2098" /LENGTH=48 /DNA_ID= /DNA_START= /DNA_END= /DNA_ORIENTATION=
MTSFSSTNMDAPGSYTQCSNTLLRSSSAGVAATNSDTSALSVASPTAR